MGKYAATKGIQNNKAWKGTVDSMFKPIESEGDYRFQSFLAAADPTGLYGAYITSRDSTNFMRDYLTNRGLDWSDIKYPSLSSYFMGSGRLGSAVLTVSKNIAHLYS